VDRGRPALQHPELLSEDQDLQIFGRIVSAWEDEQVGKHADDQREYEEHRRMVRSPWEDANPSSAPDRQ